MTPRPLTPAMRDALAATMRDYARDRGRNEAREYPRTVRPHPGRHAYGPVLSGLRRRRLVEVIRGGHSYDVQLTGQGIAAAAKAYQEETGELVAEAILRAAEAERRVMAEERAVMDGMERRVEAVAPFFEGMRGPGNYYNMRSEDYPPVVDHLREAFCGSPHQPERRTVALTLENVEDLIDRAVSYADDHPASGRSG